MNYPLILEYIEAIKSAEDNFEQLKNLRPVLGDDGLPVMTSGNFAVVFKMKDEQSGKFYAVKCFTKEQEGRAEAYQEIAKELKDVSSPYLVSIQYLEKELFVDTDQTTETEFPVLLMDWVEGKTLDKYLRENLDDKYALEMLAYRFSQLAQWLISQPFAHGDLKPDNIIVREDGTLVLVDYDGMYVPAMKGQKARELGSPDYRHPLRTENDFDDYIDDFSLVSILLSLKAISFNPQYMAEFGTSYQLLFSEFDYRNLYESKVLKGIFPSVDDDVNMLSVVYLYYVLHRANERYPIISTLNYGCIPESTNYNSYQTCANNYIDEYGVEYTSDKKVLLKWNNTLNETDFCTYKVIEGTEIICDNAFMHCKDLFLIILPKSLKYIGDYAFYGTKLSTIFCDSPLFVVEDGILFSDDKKILYYYPENRIGYCFEVPECVKIIKGGCFSSSRFLVVVKLKHIYYNLDDMASPNLYLSIPKGAKKHCIIDYTYCTPDSCHLQLVTSRNNIFEGDIIVDNGVVYSADKSVLYRYPYWLDGEEYRVDERCKIIEEAAFDDSYEIDEWGQHIRFNNLKSLYLPSGLEMIKDYAFVGCGMIENITIPLSVSYMGDYVFGQCVNLISLTFLSKVDKMSESVFYMGKTMPGTLTNPNVPFISLGWEKNDIDIVVCPKGTESFYNEILKNNNSKIFELSKDEEQLKKENPNSLYDEDVFSLSTELLRYAEDRPLRYKAQSFICEIPNEDGLCMYKLDLEKLKEIFVNDVFDLFKQTNRIYGHQKISGICYITRNYRSKFISDEVSFASYEEAIDFVCRIFFDEYGKGNYYSEKENR